MFRAWCEIVLAVFIPYIGSWLVRALFWSIVAADKDIYRYVVFTKYTRWFPFCREMTTQQTEWWFWFWWRWWLNENNGAQQKKWIFNKFSLSLLLLAIGFLMVMLVCVRIVMLFVHMSMRAYVRVREWVWQKCKTSAPKILNEKKVRGMLNVRDKIKVVVESRVYVFPLTLFNTYNESQKKYEKRGARRKQIEIER